MQGLVLGGSNNFFDVECPDGAVRQCSLKGKKLKAAEGHYNALAPGDMVETEPDSHSYLKGQITDLVQRKNIFTRWNVKGRSPQVLAANLDYALCVTTPDYPPFRPRFIDRLLVQCAAEHIEPVIVCNKSDLAFAPETEKRLNDWRRLGYTVLKVSAKSGLGLDSLATLLAGTVSAFVGQSGVGKSSILNALDPALTIRTDDLCEKYQRGRHTTTKGELRHLDLSLYLLKNEEKVNPAAHIIDTPGIRRFVLHGIEAADLALYFPEMETLVGTCAFGMSCSHTHETGCSILEGVSAGAIPEERYQSWQRIRNEILTDSWDDYA